MGGPREKVATGKPEEVSKVTNSADTLVLNC